MWTQRVGSVRLTGLAGIIAASSAQSEVSTKPNVLMVVIDDQNDWVGAFGGHPMVKTPNMDALAARGAALLNAQVPAPLCNPSRTAILMGLRPSTTGIYALSPYFRDVPKWKDWVTLPQYFHDHGYRTSANGKVYHQVGNQGSEFDEWGGLRDLVGVKPDKRLIDPMPNKIIDWGVFPHNDEDTGDYKVASWAVEQIRNAPKTQPFFVAAGFHLPHVQTYVSPKWWALYPDDDSILPPVKENERAGLPRFSWYLHWSLPEHRLSEVQQYGQWRNMVHAYLSATSFIDAQIGRMLDALNEAGLAENTIVVVFGDNGYHLGEKEITGKNSLWARSTRVPLIFAGPGIISGGRCTQPVELLDIYPTLIDLCGLPPRTDLDGISIRPQLENAQTRRDRPAVTDANPGNHSVCSEQWRYIHYADGSEELYDMQNDPHEWNNLAQNPEYQPVLAEHRKWLPSTESVPASGSESGGRLLTYDPVADTADWQGKITIYRTDSILGMTEQKKSAPVKKEVRDEPSGPMPEPLPFAPPPADLTGNFTMAGWMVPDQAIVLSAPADKGITAMKGQAYLVEATPGHKLYGENHSGAGISTGTNGLMIIEHSGKYLASVLTLNRPLAGRVYVTIVYQDGSPSLYLNGKPIAEGIVSGRTVHPGTSSSWTLYGKALTSGQVRTLYEQAEANRK